MSTPARRLRSIGQRDCRRRRHDCRRGRHDCRRNATGCDRPSIPEAQAAKSGGGGWFLQSVAFCRISSAVFVSFAPANHQRTAWTGVCVRGRCRSGRDHPAPRTQCPHPGPLQRERGSGTPRDFSATLEMTWPHQPPRPAPPCALARTWTPAFAGVTGAGLRGSCLRRNDGGSAPPHRRRFTLILTFSPQGRRDQTPAPSPSGTTGAAPPSAFHHAFVRGWLEARIPLLCRYRFPWLCGRRACRR